MGRGRGFFVGFPQPSGRRVHPGKFLLITLKRIPGTMETSRHLGRR